MLDGESRAGVLPQDFPLRLALKTVAVREDGCFSVLLWDGRPFAVSVERTFEEMRVVIPTGTLTCHRSFYHKGGYETFEIAVPGHARVLFHKGNVETDSEACVLVGKSYTVMDGVTAISDSKGGFAEFMTLTVGLASFEMEVSGR